MRRIWRASLLDPDYGTISDIDPDGDAAYTTLQGWFEDTRTEVDIQHARCHHGEAAGLGTLSTFSQNWVYTPTADEPVCIYAASGEEADGSQDDNLQGSAIIVVGVGAIGLHLSWPAVIVAQLRVTVVDEFGTGIYTEREIVLVEQNTIIIDNSAIRCTGVVISNVTFDHTNLGIIRNNLILNTDSAQEGVGVVFVSNTNFSMCNGIVYGNSLVNCTSAFSAGMVGLAVWSGDVVNIEARNNLVVDDGTVLGPCFSSLGDGIVTWNNCDYNVSSDDTADVLLGGANNIINAAIADVWADITDNDTPFAPLVAGDLDPANGVNLYTNGIIEDAIGQPRTAMPNRAHYRGGITLWRKCPLAFKRNVISRGVS